MIQRRAHRQSCHKMDLEGKTNLILYRGKDTKLLITNLQILVFKNVALDYLISSQDKKLLKFAILNTGADKYFVAPAPAEMFKKAPAPAPAPEKMLGSNAPAPAPQHCLKSSFFCTLSSFIF